MLLHSKASRPPLLVLFAFYCMLSRSLQECHAFNASPNAAWNNPSKLLTKHTSRIHSIPTKVSSSSSSMTTTTQLAGRRWNFNDGQGPFGLKKNAEIWNGRVAQMAFVAVVIQEVVTGEGVITGIQEGNPFSLACLALTVLSILGLTAFLALKGTDNYVDEDLRK